MREGEIGHTRSTVLDAPVTQRAMHVIGRGWGAARITGRGSDTQRALSVQKSPENAHNVRNSPENADGARTSPDKANVVRISLENASTSLKPSHKRTRKHERGRTHPYVLSYSIHHTKRRDTSVRGEQP